MHIPELSVCQSWQDVIFDTSKALMHSRCTDHSKDSEHTLCGLLPQRLCCLWEAANHRYLLWLRPICWELGRLISAADSVLQSCDVTTWAEMQVDPFIYC